jgi:oligosaccharyltransferase complex subunit alpha (ribophorin I)
VNIVLTNGITSAFPKEIEQSDNQKLLYTDNAYFYSPYAVSGQKTTIELGTSIIDSYTSDIKPSEKRGSSIIYGPFSNQQPFAYSKIRLHYQNNNPYVVVSKVERHVEISHWGNIAVEEQYDVKHGGAKFKGSFSRSDYARNPAQSAPASFRDLTAKLPLTAADVYFRDRIGNISTSTVRTTSKNVEVDFLPRFPLFGGWRIRFTIGYNLPTPPFLSTSGDKYKFVTKLSVPFDFAPVDDLTLRVVIPEGATDVKVFTPFAVDSESRELLKTYLDTTGRTVVVIKKTKLSPEHNQDVTITYKFASTSILREPALVIGLLLALCIFMMAYVRFDLTIQKSEGSLAEERDTKIAEVTEEFVEKQLATNALYSDLENAIQRISKDDSRYFDEEFARVTNTRNTILNEVSEIVKKLTELQASEVATKIRNVLASDKNKFDVVQDLAKTKKDLAKSADNKSREQLAKALKPLETKYDTYSDEITSALDQLSE